MTDIDTQKDKEVTSVQPPAPAKKKIVLRRSAVASTSVLNDPLKYEVQIISKPTSDETTTTTTTPNLNTFNNCDHKRARILSAKYLTKFDNVELGSIKRVIEIKLDLENDVHYQPGDYISVFSPNPHVVVDRLLARLDLNDGEQIIVITTATTTTPTVAATTNTVTLPVNLQRASGRSIRYLLTNELDICGIVPKRLLRLLGELATDEQEKSVLLKSATIEGKDIYAKFLEERVNLLSLLERFPSVKPPSIQHLIEIISPQAPRDYSICSSPLIDPTKASFVFSVVDYPNVDGKHIYGLCTTWLESICKDNQLLISSSQLDDNNNNLESTLSRLSLTNDDKQQQQQQPVYIPYNFKSSPHFHLPTDCLAKPIIMIGPGTGVAPFIGFLQHLEILNKRHDKDNNNNNNNNETWLFFGCRSETKDFIYQKEFNQFLENNTLKHLVTAFSRELSEQSSTKDVTLGYVQEKIKNHSKALFDLMHTGGAYVYICGDAKGMSVGVRQSFIEIIKEQLDITDDNSASEIWVNWSKEKRYLLDVWS
ncbi:hypothetical protein PPL_07539 [Heterostelium album PN500]|uniref:FAD-binding FR-type domain-containing protein n=1 Tax=Heterostelium pallidum (strain ATCC 26659 / Pp 5 / PN500) TaxID=670386 RepID=D3BG88_HETP5|nr:hypothetical protein PPL_07539 [Heterostelium album PN500]EFA79488.1 hypothetical protein PPL_07539 [Heterostelium album PN500]|eukprot:XP_020431609.1 hypothetical protein PPL_07539 [Heterostelium album PN500]